ncbi:MAG: hypothetical protein HQL28_03085 [Candidatus Omnitrophica bacterium]|nr:hypothetical protein [Candidatus Omnitrophota bacterium]
MPYDPSLDSEVFSKTVETEGGKVTVKVMSYNGGAKKLQISREIKNKEGMFQFSKLGRLSKDETEKILPFIQEAVGKM